MLMNDYEQNGKIYFQNFKSLKSGNVYRTDVLL